MNCLKNTCALAVKDEEGNLVCNALTKTYCESERKCGFYRSNEEYDYINERIVKKSTK